MPRVGRVLGTEDSTPLEFWVGIEDGTYLQLDDVVMVQTEVPGAGPLRVSGLVDMVRARHEGSRFDTDVFLADAGAAAGRDRPRRARRQHALRARALRAAPTRRCGRAHNGRGARRGALLRHDGGEAGRRRRPRPAAGLHRPVVPRRPPRRAREHLRRSPASRRRRRTRASCSTRSSTATCSATRRPTPRR